MAPEILHNKGNHMLDLQNCLFRWMFIHYAMVYASFYLLLSSNHLQKVRNLQIGVDKLVGKVLMNLLRHTKSAAHVIIDAPAVAYTHS